MQASPILLGSPAHAWRVTSILLVLLTLAGFLWLWFGQVDIVVKAPGKTIPSTRLQTLSAPELSHIRALHVREGQRVRAGELLLELETAAAQAEHFKALEFLALARLQSARARALLAALDSGGSPRMIRPDDVSDTQWMVAKDQMTSLYDDYLARLRRLDLDIVRHQEAIPLVTERSEDYRRLLAEGFGSRHAWLEREQLRLDVEGRLREALHQRALLAAQFRLQVHEMLTEASRQIAAYVSDGARTQSLLQYQRVTAPVDGVVHQLSVHTVGGVVNAAQPLLQLVPAVVDFEFEARVDNRDIAFLRIGQTAEIRLDAYDYTRHGTAPATVTYISDDAVIDAQGVSAYVIRLALQAQGPAASGLFHAWKAGLSGVADVRTGDRRLMDYVLSPFLQHGHEALRER